MIIDNGVRRELVIAGVFNGTCGESRGRLAFIPNRFEKRPEEQRGGLLDGNPIRLCDVHLDGEGPAYTAAYGLL
jgi:hypothetical protein